MWHRIIPFVFVFTLLGNLLATGPAGAQELPDTTLIPPLGGTEESFLRIQVVAAQPRLDLPRGFRGICDAEVTVDVLALDGSVLASSGPVVLELGQPNQVDYEFLPSGPPPNREEVVQRLRLRRQPKRPVERSILPRLCPVSASWQIVDRSTGETTHAGGVQILFGDGSVH